MPVRSFTPVLLVCQFALLCYGMPVRSSLLCYWYASSFRTPLLLVCQFVLHSSATGMPVRSLLLCYWYASLFFTPVLLVWLLVCNRSNSNVYQLHTLFPPPFFLLKLHKIVCFLNPLFFRRIVGLEKFKTSQKQKFQIHGVCSLTIRKHNYYSHSIFAHGHLSYCRDALVVWKVMCSK